MPKYLKYALFGVGGLVALLAIALAVIAITVNPNDFKPMIVKMVQEKKQRTLTIQGDIKLKLFPKLGIDLGKAVLSEHKGAQEFAAIDSLRFYVAWLPLLKQELVVDKITIEGVRAHLIRFADGSTNIDDLLAKEESAQVKFDIDSVKLSGGAMDFDDRLAKRKLELAHVEVHTGRLADGVPTDIKLDLDVKGDNPAVAAHVALQSGLLFELKTKHYALTKLDLGVKGEAAGIKQLDLSVKGDIDARAETKEITVKDLKLALKGNRAQDKLDIKLDAPKLALTEARAEAAKLTLDAKIERAGGKLAALLTLPDLAGNANRFSVSKLTLDLDGVQGESRFKGQLTTPFVGSLDTQLFELAKIAAHVDISNPKFPKGGAKLTLNGSARADLAHQKAAADLATKFDDSTIQAKLGVSPFSPPHFSFDVTIDQLDVDRYLPPKAKEEKPKAASPIDLSGLKDLRATGSLRIGQLKVMNLKSSNVRLDVKSGGGRIDVSPLSANLYKGSLSGALGATASANPQFSVRQNLSNVSIGPLLKDLADKDLIEGTGDVALNVTTRGSSADALKKALDGTASAKLHDGAIKGIDIAGTIRGAKTKLGALRGEQTQAASSTQQTDFSELSASFNIKDGVAHNDDLLAKSPLLRLAGAGDINIGAGSMDYVAKATVVGSLEGQGGKELAQLKGVTIPVRVTGPFDALKYKLDYNALAQEAAKAQVKEKIQEQIQKKGGKDLLKGLFGK